MAHFEGEVRVEWLTHDGEDRDMQLLEPFAFVDDQNVRWEAPTGSIINGASIPETLWSKVVGTPYIGDYRRASVIHDVACQQKTRPHKTVHRMFYDAMLSDGVDEARAQVMYFAVRTFGPKWQLGAVAAPAGAAALAAPRTMSIDELETALDAALGE